MTVEDDPTGGLVFFFVDIMGKTKQDVAYLSILFDVIHVPVVFRHFR